MSPCLFNSYAEYIIQNTRLDEPQIGIMIAGRNINNLSYADNTTLMPESEEELKSLLIIISVKEESEKASLKLSTQKTKIMAFSPIISWQIDGETMEIVTDFIFLGPKSLQMVTAGMKLTDTCFWKKRYDKLSVLKSRYITWLTNVRIVKAIVFPVVMYGFESWITKKG